MPGVVKFITAADIPKGGINNFTPTSFGLAVEEVGSIGTCNSVIIFLSVGHLTKIAWLSGLNHFFLLADI